MATFKDACKLARDLPGVEESTSYGTPALKVKGKLFARLKEDGESLMVKCELDEKEALLAAEPEKFFTTPHYNGYPAVLVRLKRVDRDELRELLTDAWRFAAPKRMLAEFDAQTAPQPPL